MDDQNKLALLEEKLENYRKMLAEKMKNFHGVKHENSLSELRYTQVMVTRDIIRGLEKEISGLRFKNGLK